MPSPNKSSGKVSGKRREISPAKTPEEQEQRMINLTMRQTEQMLQEGRAPAPVLVHFLRLATEKTKLENKKLEADTKKSLAQVEQIEQQKHSDELYEKALAAFKSYGGGTFGAPSDDYGIGGDYYDD